MPSFRTESRVEAGCQVSDLILAWPAKTGKDNEDAADRRIGKSRASPDTQAARKRRHAGYSRCSRATVFEPGSRVHQGVLLDRSKLTEIFRGCDCIVHIPAWHGIHEDRDEKPARLLADWRRAGRSGASGAPMTVSAYFTSGAKWPFGSSCVQLVSSADLAKCLVKCRRQQSG